MSLDWPNQPTLLLGRKIEVEWKQGKMYKGKVTSYNSFTKRFTIVYEDNEEKEYDMFTKTFKIEGENQIWTPELSNSRIRASNFPANFSTYTPRISGASTLVTFSVVIDPQLLDPGDRIVINGNLPEFTGWQDGLAMVPSENSYLWSISLELPFSTADSSPYGIFRYRYEILTRNGNIIEGNLERTEQVLRSHYFHFFRGNFRAPRFRGWIAPAPKDLFQYFCRTIIAEFSNDSINIDQAFKRHGNLISCFPDAHRLFVEILFEEYLQSSTPSLMLCALYLGLIGAFGLTSEEKVYLAGSGASTSYSYVGGLQVSNPIYSPYGTMTKRKPPKPTLWVCYCAMELDVVELYQVNWPVLFGPNFRWVSRGAVEAIERLSEHGSYDWLRIIPLASKFSLEPRIVHMVNSGKGKNAHKKDLETEEHFLSTANNICTLICEQLHLAIIHSSAKSCESISDVIGLGSLVQDANDAQSDFSDLARDLMKPLVLHAPSLAILSTLLLDESEKAISSIARNFPQTQDVIIESLRSRLEDEDLTASDFKVLETILTKIDFLPCPQVAVALFKNSSCDLNIIATIPLIDLCLRDKNWKPPDHEIQDIKAETRGLDGIWHELNAAAKEFISRKHGSEPPPEMVVVEERKDSTGWGFPGWGMSQYPEKRPKRLSEEEQLEQYKTHLNLALLDIQSLLTIPFFATNPKGLLFEFGRCWFVKSANMQQSLSSFGALCSLGSKSGGYVSYHPQLADYLANKVLNQLKDIALTSNNVRMALHCLKRDFTNESPLAHHLLYHLALFLTWPQTYSDVLTKPDVEIPPFRSLLENHEFWRDLNHWMSGSRSESKLLGLLSSVHNLLSAMVASVEQLTCNLKDMHTIMDNLESFFLHHSGVQTQLKVQQIRRFKGNDRICSRV
jgi:small nuclear ribonucleoprotein (snRNP)-like protein